jgi:hypothetical protein
MKFGMESVYRELLVHFICGFKKHKMIYSFISLVVQQNDFFSNTKRVIEFMFVQIFLLCAMDTFREVGLLSNYIFA